MPWLALYLYTVKLMMLVVDVSTLKPRTQDVLKQWGFFEHVGSSARAETHSSFHRTWKLTSQL